MDPNFWIIITTVLTFVLVIFGLYEIYEHRLRKKEAPSDSQHISITGQSHFNKTDVQNLPKVLPRPLDDLPYFERPLEKKEELKSRRILVLGKPSSGKTRYATELAKKLPKRYEFVVFYSQTVYDVPKKYPDNTPRNDVILFFDDIRINRENEERYKDTLKFFEKEGIDNFYVIATLRNDRFEENKNLSFWDDFQIIQLADLDKKHTETLVEKLLAFFTMDMDKKVKEELVRRRDGLFSNYVTFFKILKQQGKSKIEVEDSDLFKDKVTETFNTVYLSWKEEKYIFEALSLARQGSLVPHRRIVTEIVNELHGLARDFTERNISRLIDQKWIYEKNEILLTYDAYIEGKADFEKNVPEIVDALYNLRREVEEEVLTSLRGISNIFALDKGYRRSYPKEVERTYRIILKNDPKDSITHNNLGSFLSELGRKEEAEKEYREAIKCKPDLAEAHNNLGSFLSELGRKEEAEKEYREAIKCKPDLAEAHYNLGLIYSELNRKGEAEIEYREALKYKPDFAEACNNLSFLLYELGRKEEAVKFCREAIKYRPDLPDAHYGLGVLLSKLDREDEAEKEYREAIKYDPDYIKAYNGLGVLLSKLERKEEAEKSYREAINHMPDYVEAHHNLGALLYELDRKEEAEKEYREAIKYRPNYVEAHHALAVLLYEIGRKEEAEKEFREAIGHKANFIEAHYNLGVLLYELNRVEEAEEELKETIACKPDYALAYRGLGLLHFNSGKIKEAIEMLEKALQLKEQLPDKGERIIPILNELKKIKV